MELIPVVFIAFKVLVFGLGMFFAIKWHYDQDKKNKDIRAVLRAGALLAAVFVLLALGLVLATFSLAKSLGVDLTLP